MPDVRKSKAAKTTAILVLPFRADLSGLAVSLFFIRICFRRRFRFTCIMAFYPAQKKIVWETSLGKSLEALEKSLAYDPIPYSLFY